jgi:glycoside/pentoside/hexuronide:cation symporter, GPH family
VAEEVDALSALGPDADGVSRALDRLRTEVQGLTQQTPAATLRLRVLEIGLPMVLCIVSFWLLRFYPLTDERAYEVKALLAERKQKASEA